MLGLFLVCVIAFVFKTIKMAYCAWMDWIHSFGMDRSNYRSHFSNYLEIG